MSVYSSSIHPAVVTRLLEVYPGRPLKASEEVLQWMRLLFSECFFKWIKAAKNAHSNEGGSAAAIAEAGISATLSPTSPLMNIVLKGARQALNDTGPDLQNPPKDLAVIPSKVRLALLEGDEATWGDANGVQEAAIFLCGGLTALFIEFIRIIAVVLETDQNDITESHVAAALDANPEISSLFLTKNFEQRHIILKVINVKPGTNNVLKTVKVDLDAPVRNVIEYLRGKWGGAEDKFCLFLPEEEYSDSSEGIFLDPDRNWHYYPSVHANSLVEFRKLKRIQPIYIDERQLQQFDLDETLTIEQIVKLVTSKLGIRDPTRFGLLLLGKEEEVRQRREELEGLHPLPLQNSSSTSTVLSPLGPSGSSQPPGSNLASSPSLVNFPTLERQKTIVRNRASEPSLVDATRSDSSSPPPLVLRAKATLTKRPVSQLFYSGVDGVSRTNKISERRRTSDAKNAAASAINNADFVDYVQTKDQADWLPPDATLRSLGITPLDNLLLVRQEKILNFFDRLNEDPTELAEDLIEDAEEVLAGLKRVERDMESFLMKLAEDDENMAVRGPEFWVAPVDHKGARDGELSYREGDRIEIDVKEGSRWQGTLNNVRGWFEPVTAASTAAAIASAMRPAKLERVNTSGGPLSRNTLELSSFDLSSPSEGGSSTSLPNPIRTGGENPIKMEGYLLKKGRTFDQWKRKYYVLRSHCMWYYVNASDEKAAGHFSVLGADVSIVQSYRKRPNVFSVTCNNVTRFLSAATPNELRLWVDAVQRETARD